MRGVASGPLGMRADWYKPTVFLTDLNRPFCWLI